MKTTRIEHRDFPSVAEAVSHYYKQGYVTCSWAGDDRFMRKPVDANAQAFFEVKITHAGLLDVNASVVYLEHA